MTKLSRRELIGAAGLAPMLTARNSGPKQSLTRRARAEIYTGRELDFIGMPIGGCFAGTVYLGGDGQLWNWDIFNRGQVGTVSQSGVVFMGDNLREQDGANYVRPPHQQSPFRQRFDLFVEDDKQPNRAIPTGLGVKFGDVSFRGEYPIGKVKFRGADHEVEMDLEAFSPFIPLDIDRSSYPATTMTYKVKNTGTKKESYRLVYAFENPVLAYSKRSRSDFNHDAKVHENGVIALATKKTSASPDRPDVLVEDWSSGTYGSWVAAGTAFGEKPRRVSDLPSYMGSVDAGTEFVVNSHQNRNGEDVVVADQHVGTLTSPVFTATHGYINIRVGGGSGCRVFVLGHPELAISGDNSNRMVWKAIPIAKLRGKSIQLVIEDNVRGGWGQIGVGEIYQSDSVRGGRSLEGLQDFGSFAVEVLDGAKTIVQGDDIRVEKSFTLAPGESREVTFLIGWNFPNRPDGLPGVRHWYASRWQNASETLADIRRNFSDLREKTRLWNRTWYNSTLPHWFLDRTFVNLSTLATTTCYRFDKEGRFYFSEGVGCCAGTCTHVWGYAQAIAYIFPQVERFLRSEIDFGRFVRSNGAIDYRGEYAASVAHDGQASCVLRFYREHQMSPDNKFLKSRYKEVKSALEFLIREDKDQDGLLEGAQYNTLDAAWYGKMAWISSLYIAALRAGEAMAKEMGDTAFEVKCREIAEKGSANMVIELFNGEYFIHKPDPTHPEANNTNDGCHIDQLYGQFWAHQLGLPRVVPQNEGKRAMAALFKHSFQTDVWEYRRKVRGITGGRWYAMPGEGGLIMCTFPRGGAERATGKGGDSWAAAYFNECMSGFEYQAAANMIHEGLVNEGLTVVRAIHDRYHPSLRNPYNEVECSDHYGRAMASFGCYLALTGMQINSPRGEFTLAPKQKGKVVCAFVDATGWGTATHEGGKTTREYAFRI